MHFTLKKNEDPYNLYLHECISGYTQRTKEHEDVIWLKAENKKYKSIKVTKDNDFIIWGIVTNVIKSF